MTDADEAWLSACRIALYVEFNFIYECWGYDAGCFQSVCVFLIYKLYIGREVEIVSTVVSILMCQVSNPANISY